jgi:hypothetical protein
MKTVGQTVDRKKLLWRRSFIEPYGPVHLCKWWPGQQVCVCVCVCVCTGRPQGRDYLERAKCFVRYGFVGFVCYCWLTIAFTFNNDMW